MNILLAPDSFKGSLSAVEVCRIASAALRESIKGVAVQAIPVADGDSPVTEWKKILIQEDPIFAAEHRADVEDFIKMIK